MAPPPAEGDPLGHPPPTAAEDALDDVVRRVRELSGVEAAPGESPAAGSRTEEAFVPLAPDTLLEARLTESQVEALVLKYLLARGEASGAEVAEQIALPFKLVERILFQG